MHQAGGDQRALVPRVDAYRLAIFQQQERGQRPACFHATRSHELRDLEDMDRREIAVVGLALVDVGQRRVGGTEIETDVQASTRSRTLNSSFQRRPSRATHHNCSTPVSVTTLSNETGTTSEEPFSASAPAS